MEVDKTLKVSDHDVWINDFMRGDKTYLGREPQRRAVERWCQQHDSQCETERQERPHRAASALSQSVAGMKPTDPPRNKNFRVSSQTINCFG